ncbi:MAG: mechanosensitive ion channel family protein [Clostridia bacterium]|nr:mechanosensitive ion channel family protein [Clostridia bacterium]
MEQINSFIEKIKERNLIDVLIAIVIIIVFYMVSSLFSKLVMKLLKIKGNDKEKIKNSDIYKALKGIFLCLGIYIALLVLNLPENWFILCSKIVRIFIIINTARVIAELISPESKIMRKVGESEKFSENKVAISVISKVIKVVLYIIAGFMIIADLGYDLSGLITGLGLSSVVIALAAQELAENLLSGFAIITDKPFEIGDYIQVGSHAGTVEEIKFRSTKIRTAENAVITIQNSKIVSESVVNVSKIDKRRIDLSLRLPLDITASQISELIESIKLVLYSNTEVISNSLQVNVGDIEEDAIKISIYFFVNIIEFTEFLKFKTKANLSIMKLLEDKEVKLAYPSRNIYVKNEEI